MSRNSSMTQRLRASVLSVISATILTACTMTTGSKDQPPIPTPKPDPSLITVDSARPAACFAFVPLSWSEDDTDQTITEVKANNAVWKRICRQEPDEEGP